MKTIVLCLGVAMTVLVLRPSFAAPTNAHEQASCKKFVGEFYAWYVAHGKNSDPLTLALKRYKRNFSAELLRRLEEDRVAASKSPNEIVGLDFDPVLNSQDFADKYVPGKVSQRGDQFRVEVHSIYSGKKSEVPAVTPELRRVSGRWVFMNFRYRYDNGSDDLLNILKKLRDDRRKHR